MNDSQPVRASPTGPQRRGAVGRVWVAMTCCLLLAGCVDSLPHSKLPELAKDPRPVLTPDQQKAAAADLTAKKNAKRDAAIKEIEEKR